MLIGLAWRTLREVPYHKRWYHVLKILLAKLYLSFYPNIEIIGIAGSVGKTTTKEVLAQVLKQKYKIKYSRANIDPIFNIPSTILSLRPGDQKLILELSIDSVGDMECYLAIARPTIVVLTKLSLEHTQFFKTFETVIAEESKALTHLTNKELAVIQGDDEQTRTLGASLTSHVQFFGWDSDKNTVYAANYQDTNNGSSFTLHTPLETTKVTWQLAGKHIVYAALASAIVGNRLGMTQAEIIKGLESATPPPDRMNLVHYNGATIINDTYNAASPPGMIAALEFLMQKATGRSIAILATMKELGDYAEEAHREVGRTVAKLQPTIVMLWNEHTEFIADEAIKSGYPQDRIIQAQSYNEILNWVKTNSQAGDTVLIKGSRHHIHLERIALALQGNPTNIHCPLCPECV